MTALPDPERTRVLLIGASGFTSLAALPAVAGNLALLRDLFTDLWGLPPGHVTVVANPSVPRDVSRAVQETVDAATDTLLVYYAGHGLLDPRTGKLHLATETSDPTSVHDTATPYEWIRWPVEKSPATRRIVVLDCCYSARAFGVQSAAAALEVDGTYLLAASAETAVALSPPDEPLTAFTGELVTLMQEGVPGGPEYLDLDTLFTRLRTRLVTRDRPEPQRLCRNQLGQAPFIRNAAYTPPPEPALLTGPPQAPEPPRTDQAIAGVYTARSLADTLQAIADAAVSGFGYELACVNFVRPDGDLVVAALAGNPAAEALITGRVGSRASWERRLGMGEDWSGLRFIPHTEGWVLDDDDVPQFHTAGPAPVGEDGWHPGDRLLAPMYSPHGELIGVISVDRPRDGRRPGVRAREALRTYAFHSAIAISMARLRADMQRALVRLEREQTALRTSEESFRHAFEYAPNGAAVTDLGGDNHGRLLRVNDALCRLLGRPQSVLRRYSFSDLVHPEDVGVLLRTTAEGGSAELRLARRDGTYVWVSMSNSVVADTADGPRFLLTHVIDMDKRKQRETELERRAAHDELTGLYTESELRIRLARSLCGTPDAAPGAGDPHGLAPYPSHRHRGLPIGPYPTLAVLRLGVDGFKPYNTRHGRDAGDAALVEIAGRLRRELDREPRHGGLREPPVVARIRGDEFVALVPDLDTARAEALVERLRQAVRTGPLEVTGILCWATCGTTAYQVLRRSGELLHARKLLPAPSPM
ncbi:hypothetical protein SUDANB25_04586 [Streptomyces sp. SudanB25_2051]